MNYPQFDDTRKLTDEQTIVQNHTGGNGGNATGNDNGSTSSNDNPSNNEEKPLREQINEAHFIKPFLLNFGRDILVEDMQNPQSLMKMKQILLSQYHLLSPMKELLKPTDKKEFSATDIVVREFVKELMNDGKSIEQAKEQIYQSIREAECLDKPDKQSRRNTIKEAFNKLQEAEHSEWDLTGKIESALDKE